MAEQVAASYRFVNGAGWLQRSFGYDCVDAGEVPGLHGSDLRQVFYMETGIKITGPLAEYLQQADEVALFTVVEFVHDHVARPVDGAGWHHSFSGCGWHYNCRRDKFNEVSARAEWRDRVNKFLKFYKDRFELSESGEIVRIAPDGMAKLIQTAPPSKAGDTDRAKVINAVRMFQLGLSSREQRKQSVRDLVDVLEFHRSAVKEHLLSQDEKDLFNIANSFALRHHRDDQKDEYDDEWLGWLFYIYLATVHLMLGRVHGFDEESAPQGGAPIAASPPIDDDDIPF